MNQTLIPESWALGYSALLRLGSFYQQNLAQEYQEAPKWVTWMSLYASLPSSWWSGSIISARIVVPFLAIKYLGRKSIKCPGSRDISVVLLLCPLVEGFPLWEPEPLNPQNPDFQGWDAQNLCHWKSLLWSLSSSYHLVVGKVFNLLGTQHHIKVTDLECTLCPGWWHPILQGTTSKLAH